MDYLLVSFMSADMVGSGDTSSRGSQQENPIVRGLLKKSVSFLGGMEIHAARVGAMVL